MQSKQRKVLLLNSTFETLGFITERKAIKLLFKTKVDICASWEDYSLMYGMKLIKFPAILIMRYYIYRNVGQIVFSRRAVFKRDQNTCQYCSKIVHPSALTLDHIIPKSLGGKSTFLNCVAACSKCNVYKSNKTLEQTGMSLMKTPYVPNKYLLYFSDNDLWHPEWNKYIR